MKSKLKLIACVHLFLAVRAASAATLPSGFSESVVANGISSPTAMPFAPSPPCCPRSGKPCGPPTPLRPASGGSSTPVTKIASGRRLGLLRRCIAMFDELLRSLGQRKDGFLEKASPAVFWVRCHPLPRGHPESRKVTRTHRGARMGPPCVVSLPGAPALWARRMISSMSDVGIAG